MASFNITCTKNLNIGSGSENLSPKQMKMWKKNKTKIAIVYT